MPGCGGWARATAPANIAFIKYWGALDLDRGVPLAPSISMTLSRCVTRCSVEILPEGESDRVLLENDPGEAVPAPRAFADGVRRHLDRIRAWAQVSAPLEVRTGNSFPMGAGLASSASGFAALTLATTGALGRDPDPDTLSLLARLSGSGSAARSVLGGYVEWPAPSGPLRSWVPEGPARELSPALWWDLRDVIALVETGPKEVPSREGHRRAHTSPYFEIRGSLLTKRLARVRAAIRERDLELLGPILEEEALDLHLVAMSSRPPIFYWKPATLEVIDQVRSLRKEGVGAYFTMDAGANVHVICRPVDEDRVARALAVLPGVHRVIRDGIGSGPVLERRPLAEATERSAREPEGSDVR